MDIFTEKNIFQNLYICETMRADFIERWATVMIHIEEFFQLAILARSCNLDIMVTDIH